MNRPRPRDQRAQDLQVERLLAPIADVLLNVARQDPYFDLEGYMNRLWLKRPVQHGGRTPDGVRMHELLRSDDDRAMHDHPGDNTSIVLSGGYWEVTPLDQNQSAFDDEAGKLVWTWCGPGSVIQRKAHWRHCLILPKGATSRSIFIMGEKVRDWGFHVAGAPGNWVHWEAFTPDYQRPSRARTLQAWNPRRHQQAPVRIARQFASIAA